ncbi:MAG: beta-ketoacyl synthase chain length factor [Chitinophagaceae bacterium]
MFYIHHTTCISPQHTFGAVDIEQLYESVNNQLRVREPAYEGIPPGMLRRMGKAVRFGLGAALPLVSRTEKLDGIIIGTANGGMEDCIKFLNQIIDYEEGLLAPGNFVQSTPNAIAGQVSMISRNKAYNITHVHRGLAFETAVLDAVMHLNNHPSHNYLLGAVDEISAYNYNIDLLAGWYKTESSTNLELYQSNSPASLAGEGSAMFLVNGSSTGALAQLRAIQTLHTDDVQLVQNQLRQFVDKYLPAGESLDVLLHGENGDNRLTEYYTAVESIAGESTTIARFKHMSGEFPTASAIGCWLACLALQQQSLPAHMVKKAGASTGYRNILLYNNYKGLQNSFMLFAAL